ncbi:MAG: VWA domain-containing protein [Elusimicrobia bacterium]|jgi:uncharacterized protein YegL|nr:VWA domain-containing protein [Elusimicrobiota bacterium]
MKKKYFLPAVFLILIFLSGCDRSRKGPLSSPSSGVSSIIGSLSISDKGNFPYTDAYIKVWDQNGNPITDLKPGNIAVTEDGKPVVLLEAEPSKSPLAIVLVLDRSGTMGFTTPPYYEALNKAASGFINKLSDIDFVEIIDFGSKVEVSQTFTTDKSILKDVKNDGASAMGGTALYDAIGKGVDDLQTIGGERVLIAMTDGINNVENNYTLVSVIDYAKNKNQVVNTIGYGTGYISTNLQQISDDTEGIYIGASSADELYAAYQNMVPAPKTDHIRIRFRSLSKSAKKATVYISYGDYTTSFSAKYPDTE